MHLALCAAGRRVGITVEEEVFFLYYSPRETSKGGAENIVQRGPNKGAVPDFRGPEGGCFIAARGDVAWRGRTPEDTDLSTPAH